MRITCNQKAGGEERNTTSEKEGKASNPKGEISILAKPSNSMKTAIMFFALIFLATEKQMRFNQRQPLTMFQ